MSSSPDPITPAESRRRRERARRIARAVGFVGGIEYRHVRSKTGGAQYSRGAGSDLLVVYAEAFDRDANPDDFSLRAIIAHERGHQLLARHTKLAARMASVTLAAEEVLASLIGAMILDAGEDRDSLIAKATAEVLVGGASAEVAVGVVGDLWELLKGLL